MNLISKILQNVNTKPQKILIFKNVFETVKYFFRSFFLHFYITPVLRYVKYANTVLKLAFSKRDKV